MKTKILFPIFALAALSLLLGGCATGLAASSWPSVTADDQYAYIAGGPFVYAVNLETGVEAWRFPEKASAANPFHATPVLTEDGQLIVGGYDHKLYSVDPEDGSANWATPFQARDRWIGNVLVANEMIYAPNADYNLYALDLNGVLQWTFQADQSIWGTPVTDGENVYFGTLGSKFYAVKADSGTLVWEVELEGAVLGSPVINDGVLYVGIFDGALAALSARNGDTLWTEPANSWVWSGATLAGDTLYFGDGEGNLYALDTDGSEVWNQKLNGAITGVPQINGETMTIGTEAGNFYFIGTDGENIRPISIPGKLYGSPVAAGNVILVGLTENEDKTILVALDENGTTLWSFTPEK